MTVKCVCVKKRIDLENLFRKSKTIAGKLVFFKVKKTGLDSVRFCIVISSKVSKKAVIRNKAKRRIREIIKKIHPTIKQGQDIAIIAKKEILNKKYSEIEEEIMNMFKVAKLIK